MCNPSNPQLTSAILTKSWRDTKHTRSTDHAHQLAQAPSGHQSTTQSVQLTAVISVMKNILKEKRRDNCVTPFIPHPPSSAQAPPSVANKSGVIEVYRGYFLRKCSNQVFGKVRYTASVPYRTLWRGSVRTRHGYPNTSVRSVRPPKHAPNTGILPYRRHPCN